MKAVGIVGSPHKGGNTAYLLEEILEVLGKELETETILKDEEALRETQRLGKQILGLIKKDR
jgi:multimeric flavodoxin WrbA